MNLRNAMATLALAALLAAARPAPAADAPLLVETTWVKNFEGGDIDGWSSYPPFEDTAYDFTIIPGKYRDRYDLQGYVGNGEYFYPTDVAPPAGAGQNNWYLLRTHRPNSASTQLIGVSSQTWLFTGEDSTLEFDAWLQLPDGDNTLRVDLGAGDGKRYSHVIEGLKTGEWGHLALPTARFAADDGSMLAPGTEIQAVAIYAQIERGNPSMYVFVAVDNVTFKGQKQAEFAVTEPAAVKYANWHPQMAQRHFNPGDALTLSVKPEQALNSVAARLVQLDGSVLKDGIELRKEGDGWSAANAYTFGASDPKGPLMLELRGKDGRGRVAASDLRIWLVEPVEAGVHPRVYVTAADRPALQARLNEDWAKPIWERLQSGAKEFRATKIPEKTNFKDIDDGYLLQNYRAWGELVRGNAIGMMQNAWVYYLSGDQEAGRFAADALVKMCSWEQWVHPWFQGQGRETYYPVGIATHNVGVTYDLVYDLLTDAQRATVREGLMRNGIRNSFEEYFVDNRMPNSTSNWISHSTADPLVAVMAIMGETSASDTNKYLEPYFSGLSEKFIDLSIQTMKPDGGYGEGYGYQNFTQETAQHFLVGLQTMLGVEGLAEDLNYTKGYLYPLYASGHDMHELMDMGDSGGHIGEMDNWVWFARESDDPTFKWWVSQSRQGGWEALLWGGPEATEGAVAPETLEPGRVFPDKGNIVFRNGSGADARVFVYRAGPNYNHTHSDMGNFLFEAYGELLVDESGHSTYYTEPYYWSHYIQASGHNVILVDNNPESQIVGDFKNRVAGFQNRAKMTDWLLSDKVSFVGSELAPVYVDDIDTMQRRIWFVDPGYAIIFDKVRSGGGEHAYHWQMYPPSRESLKIAAGGASIEAGTATLQVKVLAPENPKLIERQVPSNIARYDELGRSGILPKYSALQVVNPEKAKDTNFLVALVPRKAGEPEAQIERIAGEGWVGAQVRTAGFTDRFFFAEGDGIKHERFSTDAAALWSRVKGEQVVGGAVQQATHYTQEGKDRVRADHPINVAGEITATGEVWTFHAVEPTEVSFETMKPGRVTASGAAEGADGETGTSHRVRLTGGDAVITVTY